MHPSIELISSENNSFLFKLKDLPKALMLQHVVESSDRTITEIRLENVKSDTLVVILKWLQIHNNELPKTQGQLRADHCTNFLAPEDEALFDRQLPKTKLADLINTAVILNMPDLRDALARYIVKNLVNKTRSEMLEWLDAEPCGFWDDLLADVDRNAAENVGDKNEEAPEEEDALTPHN